MKKILEVILDDDGKLKFNSECCLGPTIEDLEKDPDIKSFETLQKMERDFELTVEGLIDCIWGSKDPNVSPVIRILSMADIMASAQPYEQTEEFWFNMMHSFIPGMEKFAGKLKSKYGFKDENVERPISWVDPNFGEMIDMKMPSSIFKSVNITKSPLKS